ncbi:uncharacterized protein LOC120624012 isoform X3 [Pararge aegeria]|nr:uncharacterized protein LOC120624012 isoform X3 [Pararge aegeria]
MSVSEVVVFFVVLCAANAAFTINIYEDVKTKGHEVERCDNTACSRVCRLLGFNSGSCVGDTCECAKLESDIIEDKLERNDIPNLDEDDTGKGVRGCDPNACYQLCRRLKFPSGTCINGRCKCDNFRQDPGAMIENTVMNEARCNMFTCRQICHRLGFRYGVCVGDTCRCSNAIRTNVLEIPMDQDINEDIENSVEPIVERIVTNAASQECDQLSCTMGCRELGFPGGLCFMGKCRCNKGGKKYEEALENSLRACNSATCNLMCLRLRYHGGWCRFGRCECF